MPANVITGAKAKIRIPTIGIVGYATGISITENTLNGRVESLGYIDSREIVPISRNVQVQCSTIRIFNKYNDPVNKKYTDEGSGDGSLGTTDEGFMLNSLNSGDNFAQQLKTRTDAVLQKQYFDLEIIDSSSTEAEKFIRIYTVKNCRIASQNIVVDRNSLMGVQVVLDAEYLIRHEADGTQRIISD
jgi:hypothetical protein